MQVTLKTENAHDNVFAYDVHRLALKASGDQTQVYLCASPANADYMGVAVYVRSNHFDAEVGKVPERFTPKNLHSAACYWHGNSEDCQACKIDEKL